MLRSNVLTLDATKFGYLGFEKDIDGLLESTSDSHVVPHFGRPNINASNGGYLLTISFSIYQNDPNHLLLSIIASNF